MSRKVQKPTCDKSTQKETFARLPVVKGFAHPPARLDGRAKVWPAKVLLKSNQ